MESIITDAEYKQVIRRIAIISSSVYNKNSEIEELKKLSILAMDYEHHKYDFTQIHSAATQSGYIENRY